MAGRKKKQNPRRLAAVLCMVMCMVTAALCAVAVLGGKGISGLSEMAAQLSFPKEEAEKSSSGEHVSSGSTSGESDAQAPLSSVPSEIRAVTLRAGEDFPARGDESAVKPAIDDALAAVEQMEVMNAVVIETRTADGTVIYDSGAFESAAGEFDALAYAIDAAREKGFAVFTTYYLTDCVTEDIPAVQKTVNASVMDTVAVDAHAFASKYAPDGILADGYYNVTDSSAYRRYLRYGGAGGYEEYIRSISGALLRTAKAAFRAENPSIRFGIQSEAAWANDYEDERGSATKALFCALTEGNADTLSFLEEGLADFLAVKAYGSLDDGNIPFAVVAAWWSDAAKEAGVPLYIVHAADRAVTDAAGWGEYDQIARQVIDARALPGYSGSVFNSLSRMRENPSDFAQKLIGYYEGTVKEEHILQDLELTKPSSTKFTTYDPTVLFAGNTDPNTSATINDTAISVDANGYFQLEMELSEGENVFSIVHKGKTATYRITRVTEVIKEISPASGTLAVDGSTKLTITAVAYEEAAVTASVNGTTVTLSRSEQEDDEYRDTAYARFSGVYQVPDATTSVQNLGAVTVTGTWNGITKSKTGAVIQVNEKLLPSDGQPVVVTAALAETFPSDTLSSYSDPTYFPLPKGALDYALGDAIEYTVVESGKSKTYTFYRLQSGLRVLAEDIASVGTSSAPSGNRITGCTVTSDRDATKVILSATQQVAYTARYTDDAITVQFHYTASLPESMTLTKNPLFSAAKFSGDTLTLKLKTNGRFFGYDAWYDANGNLVLSFRNPPDVSGRNLDGASIVIDPGHGSGDTGALGFLSSYPENVINYEIASYLADILEDYGADVTLIPSNRSYYSLQQRVAAAEAADPDLFISVHNNSSSTSSAASGSEAYYFNPWSSSLAKYAAANLADALNTSNRGGKFGYYYVTRTMRYPAILIEGGFVSNQTEYHKLIDEDYQYEMAEGLADAVVSYFDAMGAGDVLTGTQSSGTSAEDAGSSDTNVQGPDDSDSSGAGTLTLNRTSAELSVGDELDLWVEWDDGEEYEIVWSVNRSGEDCVELDTDNDTAVLTALEEGTAQIAVQIKGDDSTRVICKVKITD